MDFDAPVDDFACRWHAVTFDLQNIRQSSVANEYSLSVLSKLFEAIIRYHGNYLFRKMNGRMDGTARKHNAFADIVWWQRRKNLATSTKK